MEDITEEDKNYVEYQTFPSLKWYPAMYEQSVVEEILKSMFFSFVDKGEPFYDSMVSWKEKARGALVSGED